MNIGDTAWKKLIEENVIKFSRGFVEYLYDVEGITQDEYISLRLDGALHDKEFFNIVKGLLERGISAKNIMWLLYCAPAAAVDVTGFFTLEKAEHFTTEGAKNLKIEAKRYRDTCNYLKKKRDIFSGLGLDVDNLINKCTVYDKTLKETARRLEGTIKKIKKELGFDKNSEVDIKKHSLWTRKIMNALEYLEAFNDKNLQIVAHCLKALYPGLWNEDIKTIKERIRKRVYDYEVNKTHDALSTPLID